MSWMRKVLRSVLRIGILVVVALGALYGVLFWVLTQPWVPAGRDLLPMKADAARLRRHVEVLATEVGPRDADHPESLALAADYLERELLAAGVQPERQEFEVYGEPYRNVIARLGPKDGPLLVVGAHYDAMGDLGPNPGADDNASGTAGLLEVARILAVGELPYQVELVAYANEEPPNFGSRNMGSAVHAELLLASGRLPEAMICLEMIGYYSEKQKWPARFLTWLYPDRGDFILLVGRFSDRHLTAKLKAGFRARGEMPALSWSGPFVPGMDASDHRNYWREGIPAVLVTDTAFVRNPHYHRETDLPETLDYSRMALVVEGLASAILDF